MKMTTINLREMAICILATASLAGVAQADIDYTYMGTYGNHEYWVTDLELEYYDAHEAAIAFGDSVGQEAYLASVTSQAESDWIQSNSLDLLWIGLNDLDMDGVWTWDSGEAFDWTDWAPGEPNENWGDENVVVMNWIVEEDGTTTYGWNDWKDQDRFAQALIEVVIPAPGAMALLGLAGLGWRRRRRD